MVPPLLNARGLEALSQMEQRRQDIELRRQVSGVACRMPHGAILPCLRQGLCLAALSGIACMHAATSAISPSAALRACMPQPPLCFSLRPRHAWQDLRHRRNERAHPQGHLGPVPDAEPPAAEAAYERGYGPLGFAPSLPPSVAAKLGMRANAPSAAADSAEPSPNLFPTPLPHIARANPPAAAMSILGGESDTPRA